MKLRNSRIVLLGVLSWFSVKLTAQEMKWDKTLDVYVAPNISTRFIGNINPDLGAGYSVSSLSDSFAKSDVSLNQMNYGVNFTTQKNSRSSFSLGICLLNTGFTRQKTGNMFNYKPHPDFQVYSNLSEGPTQIINYNFKYRYIAFNFQYNGRIDGASLVIRNTKLWYGLGISPAFLINSALNIYTQGFTLSEGNDISTYDYTSSTLNGKTSIQKVMANRINILFNANFKVDYNLMEGAHLLIRPGLYIPFLPSASGVQQVWCPQGSLDLGLIFPLH